MFLEGLVIAVVSTFGLTSTRPLTGLMWLQIPWLPDLLTQQGRHSVRVKVFEVTMILLRQSKSTQVWLKGSVSVSLSTFQQREVLEWRVRRIELQHWPQKCFRGVSVVLQSSPLRVGGKSLVLRLPCFTSTLTSAEHALF